ncbi:hypothetical protein HYW61_01630, partial [candidate division WWE3 bacterium]|nr:hypothetical protein [candidate division WWE3 bacterium]
LRLAEQLQSINIVSVNQIPTGLRETEKYIITLDAKVRLVAASTIAYLVRRLRRGLRQKANGDIEKRF